MDLEENKKKLKITNFLFFNIFKEIYVENLYFCFSIKKKLEKNVRKTSDFSYVESEVWEKYLLIFCLVKIRSTKHELESAILQHRVLFMLDLKKFKFEWKISVKCSWKGGKIKTVKFCNWERDKKKQHRKLNTVVLLKEFHTKKLRKKQLKVETLMNFEWKKKNLHLK